MRPSLRSLHLLRLLLPALVAALCLGPMLGAMHRVLHVPGLVSQSQAPDRVHHPIHHQAGDHDHAHEGVAALFSAHDDDSTCRLLDQLSGSDAVLPAAPLAAADGHRPLPAPWQDAALRARPAVPFQARGPPVA